MQVVFLFIDQKIIFLNLANYIILVI